MKRRYKVELDTLNVVELSRLIDLWIKNARNRDIAKDVLLNGLTYECVAEKYDLSVRQTKNIVYKVEDTIFNK